MTIKFEDFIPEKTQGGGLFSSAKYEPFHSVVNRINDWQDNNQNIEIFNIETVVLPNMHGYSEEGSTDAELYVSGESSSTFHQFIRVWYRIKY